MNRPLPRRTGSAASFWKAADRHELTYQRCEACGRTQIYPKHRCADCLSGDLRWHPSAGQARIISFTVVHRAPSKAFQGLAPYVLALVELDEGFRLMVHLPREDRERVRIGAAVRIHFERIEGAALPQGRLA
jgi:uncharacterized OB-fold protein